MKRILVIAVSLLLAASCFAGSKSFSSKPSSSKSFSSSSSKSFSSGKSYSSGNSRSYSSKPSYSSSSGKSFSSGGSKSYSSSKSPSKSYSGTTNNSWSKPSKTSFDTLGAKEQMKVESRQLYLKGQAPKTEYRAASGKTMKLDEKDIKIKTLRTQLSQEKWANRDLRQKQFYGSYYSRPTVIYSDPYPSFFWWWLLDRSLDERAMWAYSHRSSMDAARYQAMLAKDAQLEAKIKELEAKGVKADPTYTPKGMDSDLMYSNEYVDAAYNPEVVGSSDANVGGLLIGIFAFAVVMVLVWFVFVREV